MDFDDYKEREIQLGGFIEWADYEGFEIRQCGEFEFSNRETNSAYLGFKAGQQSKQAEIDALKAKLEEIENHAFINHDYERDDDHHSYWSGYNVAMSEFVGIIKGELK